MSKPKNLINKTLLNLILLPFTLKGIMLLVGTIGLIGTYFYTSNQNQTNDWELSRGIILEASTYPTKVKRSNTSGNVYITKYLPFVHYQYAVSDQKFEGTTIAIHGIEPVWEEDIEDLMAEQHWRAGAEVNVFYNPENLEEAVLVRGKDGLSKGHWISFGLFGIIFLGGLMAKFEK